MIEFDAVNFFGMFDVNQMSWSFESSSLKCNGNFSADSVV